jgi:ribonuclease P protein component
LRRRTDFAATLRAGRRRTGGTGRPSIIGPLVVVHLAEALAADGPPTQAGFVVSRAVGGAVTRNRVRRRLRHLVAPRLATLPPGTRIVVRALPAAAAASSKELGDALDGALAAMTAPAARAGRP